MKGTAMTEAQRTEVVSHTQRLVVLGGDPIALSRILGELSRKGIDRVGAENQIRSQPQFMIVPRGRGMVVIRRAEHVKSLAKSSKAERKGKRDLGANGLRTNTAQDMSEVLTSRIEKMAMSTPVDDPMYSNIATAWALLDIGKTLRRSLP